MNTNFASWKLLSKKVTDYVRKQSKITSDLAQSSLDDQTECTVWDALTPQDRDNAVKRKVRKVFVGQPITVKFRMNNTLLTEVLISNLRLVAEGVKYTAVP